MTSTAILVGTTKGLVVFWCDLKAVTKTEVHFRGFPVSMLFVEAETNTWWVALSHRHWGEKLHFSTDFGHSWQVAGLPSFAGLEYKPGEKATLKKIWCMQKIGIRLWVGTEPAALFFSDDGGQTFQLNQALWNHPSRMNENQWFGTGKDFPFLHSIQVHPGNSHHMYIGVSCAGVFETTDGGQTWAPRNVGLVAAYLPKTTPEIGHDPHQILLCPAQPEVLWQQNHCGIFRSADGAKTWTQVSDSSKVPHYGFALAIDPHNPDCAWVIPAESDEARVPLNLQLEVFQTANGGVSWISMSEGLPAQHAFDLVLRHGLARKGALMAFGTTNGNVYASFSDGQPWQMLSLNLAPVQTVAITSTPA